MPCEPCEEALHLTRKGPLLCSVREASQVHDVQLTCRADKKAVRRTITPTSEPDLFWGMRGAGGNLGVAIEYPTSAFAVPDNVRMLRPSLLCRTAWHAATPKLTNQAL